MPILAKTRTVIAVDYPGYGGSDRLEIFSSIQAYAQSLAPIFLDYPQVDLLGFHTGTLIALELTRQNPENIDKIIMIDVPFFDRQTRKNYNDKLPVHGAFVDIIAGFEKTVTNRYSAVSEARAFALWAENLRSGAHRSDVFRAAFAYDCEQEFADFQHAVTIIATQSGLLETSRAAVQILPYGDFIEDLTITAPVFEAHSRTISRIILGVLES